MDKWAWLYDQLLNDRYIYMYMLCFVHCFCVSVDSTFLLFFILDYQGT